MTWMVMDLSGAIRDLVGCFIVVASEFHAAEIAGIGS